MSLSLAPRNKIIKFKTREDEVNGFYEMLVAKTPIRGAGEHKFIIDDEQCKLLQSKNINYNVMSEI